MENDKEEDVWGLLAETFKCLDQAEEEVSLDVKERFQFRPSQDPRFSKTPLQESKQYLAFQDAAQRLLDGQLDKPTFLLRVGPMATQQRRVLQSLEAPRVKQRYEGLSDDENRLYKEITGCFKALCQGADRMLAYEKSENVEDVREGLRMLGQAYIALDKAQDEVIALGQLHG